MPIKQKCYISIEIKSNKIDKNFCYKKLFIPKKQCNNISMFNQTNSNIEVAVFNPHPNYGGYLSYILIPKEIVIRDLSKFKTYFKHNYLTIGFRYKKNKPKNGSIIINLYKIK